METRATTIQDVFRLRTSKLTKCDIEEMQRILSLRMKLLQTVETYDKRDEILFSAPITAWFERVLIYAEIRLNDVDRLADEQIEKLLMQEINDDVRNVELFFHVNEKDVKCINGKFAGMCPYDSNPGKEWMHTGNYYNALSSDEVYCDVCYLNRGAYCNKFHSENAFSFVPIFRNYLAEKNENSNLDYSDE